jgi:transcriptional regulator with XRE-family HTH domain
METGNKIKLIAEEKGISAQDLADRLGRTRQSIYDIYNGRVSLNVDLLIKIAKELNEPIINFFSEANSKWVKSIKVIKRSYPATCKSCWGIKFMINPNPHEASEGPLTVDCIACNGSGVITITETETHY